MNQKQMVWFDLYKQAQIDAVLSANIVRINNSVLANQADKVRLASEMHNGLNVKLFGNNSEIFVRTLEVNA